MTIQFEWPPEIIDRVKDGARANGLSLDEYVLRAVTQQDLRGGTPANGGSQELREEAGRIIRELRQGNILGLEMTIRDLVEEGRRF